MPKQCTGASPRMLALWFCQCHPCQVKRGASISEYSYSGISSLFLFNADHTQSIPELSVDLADGEWPSSSSWQRPVQTQHCVSFGPSGDLPQFIPNKTAARQDGWSFFVLPMDFIPKPAMADPSIWVSPFQLVDLDQQSILKQERQNGLLDYWLLASVFLPLPSSHPNFPSQRKAQECY